jgi:hypothetical protein
MQSSLLGLAPDTFRAGHCDGAQGASTVEFRMA